MSRPTDIYISVFYLQIPFEILSAFAGAAITVAENQ